MKKVIWLAIAVFLTVSGSALAGVTPDGAAYVSADDLYYFYISQDDFSAGNLVGTSPAPLGEKDTWRVAQNWNLYLVPGQTNYLHIMAADKHQYIAGVLGEFTLDSSNPYIFQNGGKALLTDTTNWTVRTDGWDNTSWATVTSAGTNASSPWLPFNSGNPVSNIAGNAQWIWTNIDGKGDLTATDGTPFYRYFSTKIINTPEPIGLALFGLGAGVLGLTKIRRKKA